MQEPARSAVLATHAPDHISGAGKAALAVFALLVAAIGGALGLLAAVVQELVHADVFAAFTLAPIIEEAMKPAGVYLLMLRWPQTIAGRIQTAALAAVGGLSFGLLESLVYVKIYFPDEGSDFALFRFTVPVAMHTIASLLFGLGLSSALLDWAAGRAPLPKRTRNFYVGAVALHATYNLIVVALALTGVLSFD